MAASAAALRKLQSYADKIVNESEYNVESTAGKDAYEAALGQTLAKLKAEVDEEATKVEALRKQTNNPLIERPADDPRARLAQLQRLKAAHHALAQAEPRLPEAGSPLPALLALRSVQTLNGELRAAVQPTHAALAKLRADLARERAALADAARLRTALDDRLARLTAQSAAAATEEPPPDSSERAKALHAAERERAQHFRRERARLFRAAAAFVEGTLAPMLAAEELGGPVAGSAADIADDALIAGFTAKGRPKRPKARRGSPGAGAGADDARQSRIDQIWGPQAGGGGGAEGLDAEAEESEFEDSPATERAAAARDMLALVERLLNSAVEEGAAAYVQLERDSAAARFLVRAKAAMLHPKDARQIRLLDFGRELED